MQFSCETVIILLPLPPRILSPNCPAGSRGGRFARAAAIKKYRRQAREAAEAAGVESGPWALARCTAAFYFPTRRRRDQDSFMAMLKPAYDGIVDAGLLIDDDYEHLHRESPTFDLDPLHPRVELTLIRLA